MSSMIYRASSGEDFGTAKDAAYRSGCIEMIFNWMLYQIFLEHQLSSEVNERKFTKEEKIAHMEKLAEH